MNPCIAILVAICICTVALIWMMAHTSHYLWKQLHEIKEITAEIRKRMN